MYLTDITRPIYQYEYRFVIRESRFWCLILILNQQHNEKEEYVS
jgi:hypothetical protein